MPSRKSKTAKAFGQPDRFKKIIKKKHKTKKIIGKKNIEKNNILNLSIKDSEAFFEAMEAPFIPNEKLKTAMKLYMESIPSAENRCLV